MRYLAIVTARLFLGAGLGLSAWLGVFGFPAQASAEIKDESWSKKASSTQEAFTAYRVQKIGVLLAAVDGKPNFGHRYSAGSLLTYVREFDASAHRISDAQELMLYERVRQGLESRGYQVIPLNMRPWKGQRLKEVTGGASGVDAVLAVHYAARRSHEILDAANDTWWSPFEGLKMTVYSSLFDAGTGDLIYAQKAEAIGTEELYRQRGEKVADVTFYGKSRTQYKSAIYRTDVFDLPTGERNIPVIRTPEGAIDISYTSTSGAESFHLIGLYDKLKDSAGGLPGTQDIKKSLLQELLMHTDYNQPEEDVRRFERLSIRAFGETFIGAIPGRS